LSKILLTNIVKIQYENCFISLPCLICTNLLPSINQLPKPFEGAALFSEVYRELGAWMTAPG
jgi:hypothetical protein